MKIVATTLLPAEGFKNVQVLFPKESYIKVQDIPSDTQILISTYDYNIPIELLERLTQLQLIANLGAGFNNIPIDVCKKRGIMVTNTPLPVIEPTAELAFALMHTIARDIINLDAYTRTGKATFGVMANLSHSLCYKTLGIIGMGRIGQALARRAKASAMNIIYHNRHQLPREVEERYEAKYVSLEDLLRESDFVSLNLPFTKESEHLISTAQLNMMKATAYLINTARGRHVDEKALVKALREGKIAGAALDVYDNEPNISPELRTLKNVVLTPHVGTGTYEGRVLMCQDVEKNILAFLKKTYNKMDLVG